MFRKNTNKVNKGNKVYFLLVQLLVIAMLVLFVFNNELVIFVKDFINALPVGRGFVESIALRGYVVFNALSSSHSLFALCLLFLHVVIFTSTICKIILFIAQPYFCNEEEIKKVEYKVESFDKNYKGCYLEHMRLLN